MKTKKFSFLPKKAIRIVTFASLAIVLVAVAVTSIIKSIKGDAEAITGDGDTVTISVGTEYHYGDWVTHKYNIATSSGEETGFCVEPSKSSPAGQYTANVVSSNAKSKRIKLAIWAWTRRSGRTAKELLDRLAGAQDFADNNFAFIHALVGYMYKGDTTGLTEEEVNYIQDAESILQSIINEDGDAWVYAKGFRLYELSDVPSNYQNIMWIENNRQYSSIEVHKCDTLNTTCTPTGSANFSGVTVALQYAGTTRVFDSHRNGGTIFEPNQIIETKVTNNDGIVKFENIPLGKYRIIEQDVNNQALVQRSQEVSIDASSSSVVYKATLKNEIVRADLEFFKVDDNGRPMANVPFRIKSNTTGESHIVVTDESGHVNTGNYAHNNHTNGYDNMNVDAIKNLGYGTWFGKDGANAQTPVNNDLGALPYDTYTITEISCSNNDHCYDISSQSKTFTVDRSYLGGVVSLGNWENDCVNFSIGTVATDNEDGDKIISAKQNAQIKDTIEYNVKKNTSYRVVGTLVDASTGQALTGTGTSKEITINPGNTEHGTAEMIFTFDASNLAGKSVVVYERIYKPGDNTNPVASHVDPNDPQQTISVFSLATKATDGLDTPEMTIAQKSIENRPDQKIKDTIDYCLKAGGTFTLKGVLMDKETGEKLTINGETFEKTIDIAPSTNCGKAELVFDLDASELKGKRIVVYEYAYQGETLVEKHENINDPDQTIPVYSLGTKATDVADDNQSIIADTEQSIKDSVEFCLTKGKTYTLKGVLMDKETREKLLIDGEPVEQTLSIIPSNDCGTAELYFNNINAAELAGKQIVVFETVYEEDEEIIKHEDFEDESQTIDVYSLETVATDAADGDKDVLGETESTIKDTIDYCLVAGKEYTIKGILMDKTTKNPLPVNGGFVENSITFTPTENCGTIEMTFTFDASHLHGAEIVVFESAYLGGTPEEDDIPVIEHKDIDDESQTVYIYLPPPDTGSFTTPVNKNSNGSTLFIAIAIGATAMTTISYIAYRAYSKNKAVKFH